MKTFSIINQKGGVGKSTTALAIGQSLSIRGLRVLYIDLDPQGNLSFTLNANVKGRNALVVLKNPKTINEEIQQSNQGDILASTQVLSVADMAISETGKEYKLREALELIKNDYDYCIIDTPPSLGILTINALTACDNAIIPAQADIYSLQGIGQLHQTIQTVKKYCNPTLSILGVLLTRYNQRSIISREITQLLDETTKQLNTCLFQTKIRECTAIKEAQATKQSIFEYASKSNATKDYKALVDEILRME